MRPRRGTRADHGRRLTDTDLSQICAVYPEAYVLDVRLMQIGTTRPGTPVASEHRLILDTADGAGWSDASVHMRRSLFRKRLLDRVMAAHRVRGGRVASCVGRLPDTRTTSVPIHRWRAGPRSRRIGAILADRGLVGCRAGVAIRQEFLRTRYGAIAVSDASLRSWHPRFPLDSAPAIAGIALPTVPRAADARAAASESQSEPETEPAPQAGCDAADSADRPTATTPSVPSPYRGVPPALLERVRARAVARAATPAP